MDVTMLLPSDSWLLPAPYLLPFVLFVLVGLALATLSEAMRKALEKAVAAEQSAAVMLHELNHRIRNNLAWSRLCSSCRNARKRNRERGMHLPRQVNDGKLELAVEDNGKGCPEGAKEGLGSRIVRLLAQQLESTMARANPGCRIALTIPEQ